MAELQIGNQVQTGRRINLIISILNYLAYQIYYFC